MQFAICNLPLRAEHPELLSTPTAAEAQRTGYSRGHAGKFVHWVEGTLTPHQVAAPTVERLSSFLVDRDQPREYRWSPSDYDGTPYDIGHLWPAAFAHSAVGERDSFLMTNTMPQAVGLNRGQWARLEAFIAQRVAGGDTAAIDAGPAFLPGPDGVIRIKTIGPNKLWVPTHCWKAATFTERGQDEPCEALAWLLPNRAVDDFTRYAVSIDALEAAIALDLFPGLDERLEK